MQSYRQWPNNFSKRICISPNPIYWKHSGSIERGFTKTKHHSCIEIRFYIKKILTNATKRGDTSCKQTGVIYSFHAKIVTVRQNISVKLRTTRKYEHRSVRIEKGKQKIQLWRCMYAERPIDCPWDNSKIISNENHWSKRKLKEACIVEAEHASFKIWYSFKYWPADLTAPFYSDNGRIVEKLDFNFLKFLFFMLEKRNFIIL